MSKKPETKFKEQVIKDLKTLPNCWFVKIQQVAIRGIPDIIASVDGKFVGIELKTSKKSPRNPLQDWTLKRIAASGALAFLAYPENWEHTFSVLQDLAGDEQSYTAGEAEEYDN